MSKTLINKNIVGQVKAQWYKNQNKNKIVVRSISMRFMEKRNLTLIRKVKKIRLDNPKKEGPVR